ncbi:MAG: 5-(carboxyamino)imidazole ribonucleotide mutase [Candidatus Omnitrophica bacterium]|nr:5-(carboxyamino)imidazole ribonucleotide mutase [Candidatus Omnitrophota bacterium]MDD5671217.1 5-(carboxyamino)imidazole ribonucleotide mutase [Candidatus Omnitrophota bacterium]
MNTIKVSILMGSDSDLEVMQEAVQVLKDFGIEHDVKVLSAHRSPALVSQFASQACAEGVKVIIAGAGGAAHLAGVLAAHTTLPVIGVPIASTALNGMDALLATVQMPAGVPVATVAVGKAGARNAAILAVQMLALNDTQLVKKLQDFKNRLEADIKTKNEKLQQKLK